MADGEYHDRWITCDERGIAIRGYYIPWGTKHIPWARLRGVRRVTMGSLTGRARIWGTANPRYWASLDPGRSRKRVALLLDTGGPVKSFVTPEDPAAMLDAIHAHAGEQALTGTGRAPIV